MENMRPHAVTVNKNNISNAAETAFLVMKKRMKNKLKI